MFLRLFHEERNAGLIPLGKQDTGYCLEVYLYSGGMATYTVTEKATRTFSWIEQNMRKDMIARK
jgi:hypothetical protein